MFMVTRAQKYFWCHYVRRIGFVNNGDISLCNCIKKNKTFLSFVFVLLRIVFTNESFTNTKSQALPLANLNELYCKHQYMFNFFDTVYVSVS